MSILKELNPSSIIYDPKVLMEEFKDHIYRLDNRNAPSKMSNEYKKIYSELAISNKTKRDRLQKTANSKSPKLSISSRFLQKSQRHIQSSAESRKMLFKKVNPSRD